MTTGEAIKNARIKANMTQAALAEKLNVTPQNISQYERDIKKPKYETIQKIADALQIPAFELMEPASFFSFNHSENHLKLNPIVEENSTIEDERLESIIENYHQLNEAGQQQLAEQAEGLTYIPKYKKRDPASDEEVG